MNIKILKIVLKSELGTSIYKPIDRIIKKSDLEEYRKSFMVDGPKTVFFTFEEID